MTITRKSFADEYDRLDEGIAEINVDKAELLKAYREQLEKDGKTKPDIAIEITAIKAAIRHRRAMARDPNAVEHKDALTDEIYVEISAPSKRGTVPALARTRTSENFSSDIAPQSPAVAPQPRTDAISAADDTDRGIPGFLRRSPVRATA